MSGELVGLYVLEYDGAGRIIRAQLLALIKNVKQSVTAAAVTVSEGL